MASFAYVSLCAVLMPIRIWTGTFPDKHKDKDKDKDKDKHKHKHKLNTNTHTHRQTHTHTHTQTHRHTHTHAHPQTDHTATNRKTCLAPRKMPIYGYRTF